MARRRAHRMRRQAAAGLLVSVALVGWGSPTAAVAQVNQPPVADAGPDQTITVADAALLLGRMSDDDLPDPAALPRAAWSVQSGPGIVVFAAADEVLTSATFSVPGTYVLRLTVDDGDTSSFDDAVVTVLAAAPNTIQVPQDHATIQAAVDAAQDGDLVLVSPGTYTEAVRVSKSITLASTYYTSGDPSLIDQTVIAAPSILDETVTFGSGAGVAARIVGFTVQDGKDGVKIRGTASIIDNRFLNLDTDAVDFSSDAAGRVVGNLMENNGDDGVDIDDASVLIEGNEVRFNVGDGVEIRATNTSGPFLTITIRNNVFRNNTSDGIQIIDDDTIGATDALLLIDRNVIADNLQAGLGLMDNADTTEDYRAASLTERIQVVHNTFTGNDHGISGGDNLVAVNNIFMNHANIAVKEVDGDSALAHNLFWNNGVDNSGSNVDAATTLGDDPMLDGNLQPLPGSPVIDAGTAFFVLPSGEVVLDTPPSGYNGAAPDIGRYESIFDSGGNQPPSVDSGADQSADLPTLSVALDGAVSDDGLPDPPAVVSTTWTQQSGPPGVTFADETAVDTTATFPGAGSYVLRLTADDSEFTVSDDVVVTIVDPNAATLEVRVAATNDDAEESASGSVSLGSSDLELISDAGDDQTVGMRFSGVNLPAGATVTAAWVQFTVDETDSGVADLTLRGEASDDAPPFTSADGDVSTRPTTAASVSWMPPDWTTRGAAGTGQRTPNLAAIIQEVIDRPGWTSDNAVVIVVTGSGERTAESFDGDAAAAPLLHIEYTTQPPPPNDPPVAGDDDVTTPEDVAVTFDVVVNDVDPDGNLAPSTTNTSCATCAQPTGGSLTNHGDGTFTYTPSADFNGGDAFTYEVCDALGACDTATVTITVTAVNDAPVAMDDAATTGVDEAATIDVLSNDVDVDGDALVVSTLGAASNGSVVDNGDGTVTYAPDPGFAGQDSFTYTATDGVADSSAATVTITVGQAAPQTIDVRIAAGNDDAEERGGGQVSLTSSDLELVVDGSRGAQTIGLRFTGLQLPQGANIVNAFVQFQVDETDSVATDLTFRGQAADAAPAFSNSSFDVSSRPQTTASVDWSPPVWSTVGDAGPDQQTPDVSSIVQEIVDRSGWTSGGSLVLIVTGSGTRVAESFNGDQSGAPLLHVEYTTTPIPNRPPEPGDDVATTALDTAIDIDVAANDSDPDGNLDPSSVTVGCATCLPPSDGIAEDLGGGFVRYTPDPGFVGDDTWSYEICDTDSLCATALVTVTVAPATPQVVEVRVSSGSDDAEERDGGTVSLTSSDLELVEDGSRGAQTVGMRFVGLDVPPGAEIIDAWVQFEVDETDDVATDLLITGQAIDDAPTFTNAKFDISDRTPTGESVVWAVAPWTTISAAGADQRTPDLSAILQELVDRPGWAASNALVLLVTGSGTRTAESYNGESTAAPLLHVEYLAP